MQGIHIDGSWEAEWASAVKKYFCFLVCVGGSSYSFLFNQHIHLKYADCIWIHN